MVGLGFRTGESHIQEVDVHSRLASLSAVVLVVASLAVMTVVTAGCSRDTGKPTQLGLRDADKSGSSSGATGSTDATGSVGTTGSPKTPSGEKSPSGAAPSDNSPNKPTAPGGQTDPKKPSTSAKTVRILWWNDTVNKPPKSPEIVFAGKSYKPASGKSDIGSIGPAAIERDLEFTIYPQGRAGKAFVATFRVTADMMSNSDVDAIHIEISDGQVRVLGNPIPNFIQAFPR